MQWSAMTPVERNDLVARELMDNEPGPYTEDLQAAWQVVERVIASGGPLLAGQDPRTYQSNMFHLEPSSGAQVCLAWFGSRYKVAAAPAQAVCLAALLTKDITFDDGHEVHYMEDRGKKLTGLAYIAYRDLAAE